MFGHQPRTATYVCLWEIMVGRLMGNLSPTSLLAFRQAAMCFVINLADSDNTLPADVNFVPDTDVTFLSVRCAPIELKIELATDLVAVVCLPSGLSIAFDDHASRNYSKHVEMDAPAVEIACLTPSTENDSNWTQLAKAVFDANVVFGEANRKWETMAAQQMRFIREQDAETGRCAFLYSDQFDGMCHSEAFPTATDRLSYSGPSAYDGPLFLPSIAASCYRSAFASITDLSAAENFHSRAFVISNVFQSIWIIRRGKISRRC